MRLVRLALAVSVVAAVVVSAQACSTMPLAGGSDPTAGGAPLSGPCAPEGAVRDCRVPLGKANGVATCFVGTQECRGGLWTSCGGREITLSSVDFETSPQASQSGIRPLVQPLSDAGQCTSDPCDPYCMAFNEDAGISAEAGVPTTFTLPGSNIFGGAPGGFAKKSDCGSSSAGCNDKPPGAPYPRKCNGEDHYNIWDSCLADTHCDVTRNNGAGACVANWDKTPTSDSRWNPTLGRWDPSVCPGVDVTVSAVCEVAKVPGFNICNRGNSAMYAATVALYIDNGNGDFGSSTHKSGVCPVRPASCSPPVPGGVLLPGRCFRVTNATCPVWNGNGNPVAYVNADGAIPECGGTVTAGASTAPGCNNNWADIKNGGVTCAANSTFIDTSRAFSYVASCPPGNTAQWKVLTYQASVPCSPGACDGTNSGAVEFYGTLSSTATGVTTQEAIIDDATTTKSVHCTYGVDAGGQPICPVDLAAWANGVTPDGATYDRLDLRIRIIPTPDDLETPTLNTWAVSYDCIPTE